MAKMKEKDKKKNGKAGKAKAKEAKTSKSATKASAARSSSPKARVARKTTSAARIAARRRPAPARARAAGPLAQDPRLVLADEDFDLSAHKFDLSAQEATPATGFVPPEFEDLGDLPAIYGTRKLFLAARDPHWVYAYWDFSHAQLSEGAAAAHDGKLFLELYNGDGSRVQQVEISPWSHDWYLHVQAGRSYHAQIGYYRKDGAFEPLARSPGIQTPPDAVSWRTDSRFVTIPFHFSFRQLLELVQDHRKDGEDLAETLARLQDDGFPFPFEVRRPPGMTEDAYAELLSTLCAVTVRRIQQGSGEILELLPKNLIERMGLSSGQWVSSPSSPFGASWSGGGRAFRMDLNAELILYGGTTPDASVRIDGETIRLTPDGRFAYHFNFKDGKFHIPIEATSGDGAETRSALLSFLRLTTTTPGVTPTPQADRPTPLGGVD